MELSAGSDAWGRQVATWGGLARVHTHARYGQTHAWPSRGVHGHGVQVPPARGDITRMHTRWQQGHGRLLPPPGHTWAHALLGAHACALGAGMQTAAWCSGSPGAGGVCVLLAVQTCSMPACPASAHVCAHVRFFLRPRSGAGGRRTPPQRSHGPMRAQRSRTCVRVHALLGVACIDAGLRCVSARLLTSSILSPVRGRKKARSPLPFLPGTDISEVPAHSAGLDAWMHALSEAERPLLCTKGACRTREQSGAGLQDRGFASRNRDVFSPVEGELLSSPPQWGSGGVEGLGAAGVREAAGRTVQDAPLIEDLYD